METYDFTPIMEVLQAEYRNESCGLSAADMQYQKMDLRPSSVSQALLVGLPISG
jgi:hypothetical protein